VWCIVASENSCPWGKKCLENEEIIWPSIEPEGTTSCWSPTRLCATDQHALGTAMQSVFNIYLTVWSFRPYFINFSIRILWETVLKALLNYNVDNIHCSPCIYQGIWECLQQVFQLLANMPLHLLEIFSSSLLPPPLNFLVFQITSFSLP